jgi:hypothetical protein
MPLSDGQLREIGRVVVAFNRLEMFLTFLVSNLIVEDEEVGYALTAGESLPSLLDKLARLAPIRVKDPAVRDRITRLLRLAKSANDRRVDVVHSVWFDFETPLEGWALRFPRRGDYKVFDLSETALEKIATAIERITQGFADLQPELATAVPHLRERFGPAT